MRQSRGTNSRSHHTMIMSMFRPGSSNLAFLLCLLLLGAIPSPTMARLEGSTSSASSTKRRELSPHYPHRHLQLGQPFQFASNTFGPSTVAAAYYNRASGAVHITGTTMGNDNTDWASACFHMVLQTTVDPNSPTVASTSFFSGTDVHTTCHGVLVDDTESRVWLAGASTLNGVLGEFERNDYDPSTLYGMMLDLNYDDIRDPTATANLQGGRLLQDESVVYTLGAARETDGTRLFVLSSGTESVSENPLYTRNDLNMDPTQTLQYGNSLMDLRVTAHDIVQFTFDGTDGQSLRQTLSAHTWNKFLMPSQNRGVQNLAGIIYVNRFVFVAGSTVGDDIGFGTHLGADLDLDGFLTRFRAADGEMDTSGTTRGSASVRFESYAGGNEHVYGLCSAALAPQYVYVVGSTQGYVNAPTLTPSGEPDLRGFVARVKTDTLDVDWVQHIEGPLDSGAEVEAISCVVSDNGQSLYVAGNVKSGYIQGGGLTQSQGGSDVFVSKLDVNDASASTGSLLWSKQFGSSADDWIAHRGGIVIREGVNVESVMVIGNTAGAMYRSREAGDPGNTNLFAVVMSADGTFTPPNGGSSFPSPPPPASTPATTGATPPATTPATVPITTPATTTSTSSTTPAPPPIVPTPSPPVDKDSKKSNRRREDWEAMLILLIVGINVTLLGMCAQQYWYHRREATTDRGKVLDYLQNFDVEDIDLKHSATGGWHCSYVNDLARGIYNQSYSSPSFMGGGETTYENSAFDPLNAAGSSLSASPESKVLQDSLFVIEDGEEMMVFGNDRDSRNGRLGSAYTGAWDESSGNGSTGGRKKKSSKVDKLRRNNSKRNGAWGKEII